MHPKDLKNKYNLTLTSLAFYLACDRRTVERYCAFNANEPVQRVMLLCQLLDFYWQSVGKVQPPECLTPYIAAISH